MLSDFYLPSPLPPLPFHKECADVDMALPSDDFAHSSSSSSSLLLQPLFDEPPPSRSFRGVGDVEHHNRYTSQSDNNSDQPTLNDPCMELAMALAGVDDEEGITMSPARGHIDSFENYTNSQPSFFSADAPLSSSLSSSPPFAYGTTPYLHQLQQQQPNGPTAAWTHHPDCPDCLATSTSRGGAVLAGRTEEEPSSATFAANSSGAALRSPGDTGDNNSSSSNTHGAVDCSPRLSSTTSYPLRPVVPSISSPSSHAHSWEGSGYYGPVPRTLSSSVGLDQLAFGGDEATDGGIYGWQPLAPSFSSPHSFFNSNSNSNNNSDPTNQTVSYPSFYAASSSCDMLSCADMSIPSPAAMMLASSQPLGASSSSSSLPMATASLSSSSPMPSYYVTSSYPPSASAPWFSSSPPVATLMPAMTPLVPLTTALPVDSRPASGSADCAAQKRKRAQQPPTNPGRPGSPHICTECGADKTPEWRRGLCGPRTLCNACGLRYAKRNKKKKEEELAAATGQLSQTPSQAARKPNRSRTSSPVPGGRRSPTPGAPLQPMPQANPALATASRVLIPVAETTTTIPAVTSNAV